MQQWRDEENMAFIRAGAKVDERAEGQQLLGKLKDLGM